jgi:trimeric autotransporter adhesin
LSIFNLLKNKITMKKNRPFLSKAFSFMLMAGLLLGTTTLRAQLNIPLTNCQNVAGTYTDLGTTGSVITTTNFDDASSVATNIGFTFNYNGQAFTQFVLNTNGFIRLGPSPPSVDNLFFAGGASYTGGPFNSTSTSDVNLICGFNHDLIGATNPEYRVLTSGTAPNRVCTIQFKNLTEKTTSPAVQLSNINFQILLYEGSDIIEIIYGQYTASTNAEAFKSAAVGLKGSGLAAGQLIAITKGSTTIYSAATFLNGNYTGNAFNYRKSVLPDPGRTLRFMPMKANDLAIMEAYTLGKAPIPFGNPLSITAWVKNGGSLAQLATTCSLTVTGANAFANVQPVPALNPGDSTLITFSAFSPTVVGVNNVLVSLPNDDNNLNNTKTKVIETNLNSYSYAQGPTPAGGVGFTGATGDFVAKFTTNSNQSINQVNVQFATGGQPFQIGIWSATITGTPGTLLHTTSTYTSTTGVYTVLIDPPVSVPAGSFFVGVRQTGTTNVSFGYQSEVPIRSGHFYYTSPTGGTTWTDFAPGSPFRFMVEPKFALQNDVGITTSLPVQGATLVSGTAYNLSPMVVNYGLASQNNIPVYYRVDNGTPVGPVTTTTSIVQNGTTSVSFSGPNAYTPASVGTVTIKYFTQLSGDLSNQNDTLSVQYTVIPAPQSTFPYNQNFTTPLNWTRSGVGTLWLYGIATGAAAATNDTAALADFYGTLANNSAMLKSPAFNISALSNPILQFDVAYRTKVNQSDTLQVMISTDGGVTFLPGTPPIYLKSTFSSPSLATLSADTANFFPSAASNWRKETVSLQQFAGTPNLMIAFKASSGNGNNCWVDNFSLFNANLATLSTAAISNIGETSASSGGNITAAGTTPVSSRGVCWSTNPGPTIADPKTVNGSGTGPFTSSITNLQPTTTYYVRAYATDAIGTVYGNELSFTTLTPATLPTVTTAAISGITHYGALGGGNVTADGGASVTARGVCFAKTANPTLANAFTSDGSGTGAFTSTMAGLDDNSVYYVRAYATNSVGTAYGNEVSFTTLIDGIGDTPENGFSAWLSGSDLLIRIEGASQLEELAIYDMNGRLLHAFTLPQGSPAFSLAMPELPTAAYLLHARLDGKVQRTLMVVE